MSRPLLEFRTRRRIEQETNVRCYSNSDITVKALFRAGDPVGKGKPARTAFVRANGGWFGAQQTATAAKVLSAHFE
jgi:hypothetical protein